MRPDLRQEYTYPLWFGGSVSCFAVYLTHPLDLTKVRMQTSQLRFGTFRTFLNVVKNDGFLEIYNRLSAGIARQLLYGSSRFAIYEAVKNEYTQKTRQEAPMSVTVSAAALAGFAGGVVGNPADLANVRMQGDSALPLRARRNYKNVIDAFMRFGREEWWRGYTRGIWANSSRASIISVCQLALYDAYKNFLIERDKFEDSLGIHFAASVFAGLVATTICSPVDVIKSRIMSLARSASIFEVAKGLWQAEELRWMFKGWTPSLIRTGPHTIATFIFLEQHKKIYRQLKTPKQELAMI